MFNRRKNNDMSMEGVEGVNDEEMSYARGNSPDVPNFEQYGREFGKFLYLLFNLFLLNMFKIDDNYL